MRYARGLAASLLIILLVACGGPATEGPPVEETPPPPTTTAFTPRAVAVGGVVTISGTDLHEAGTVTIGGHEAEIVTWTETQIEARVAAGTPEAWQQVEVTTEHGNSVLNEFFVGAEFTGVADELQAFIYAQAPGTAVLLQAAEYDLSGLTEPFVIDNRSLYGQGKDQTQILLPSIGAGVFADYGASATVADLSLEGEIFVFSHGTWDRSLDATALRGTSQSSVALDTFAPNSGLGLDDARALLAELFPVSIEPVRSQRPKIAFRNVRYNDRAAGALFGANTSGIVPQADLELTDVDVNLVNSLGLAFSAGDVVIANSNLTAPQLVVGSVGGTLTVSDAKVEVSSGGLIMGSDRGTNVLGSSATATNSGIVITGALSDFFSGASDIFGPVTISGSELVSLDADLTDINHMGQILIATYFAPITIIDNPLIRAHGSVSIQTFDSSVGESGITFTGNSDVRVGVFKSENATHYRQQDLNIRTVGGQRADLIRIEDNVAEVTGRIYLEFGSFGPAELVLSGNTMTAGDGESTGVFDVVGEFADRLEVTDNVITAENFAGIAAYMDGGTARIEGNQFLARGNSPELAVYVSGGACQVGGNSYVAETVDPTDFTTFDLYCDALAFDDAEHSFNANTITLEGAMNELELAFRGGTTEFARNSMTGSSYADFYLYGTAAQFSDNKIATEAGGLYFSGDADTNLVMSGNDVQITNAGWIGLMIDDVVTATISDNSVTNTGTPAPTAVALRVSIANMANTNVQVSGNTFSSFSRALAFENSSGGVVDMNVALTGNVFDFPIDASPKAASLVGIKDEIDARHNVWGTTTDPAVLETYVHYDADTIAAGGSILLDPTGLP